MGFGKGIELFENGGFVKDGAILNNAGACNKEEARKNTIAYPILAAHDADGLRTADSGGVLKIKFDALASHDITYVSVIQTARASGMERFPVPYIMTNCHNSLCAVGGTINEDDHAFGFSAAVKYGGIFVPAHLAVIHTYMRETRAGGGMMILGTDSHTRYGALGTLAIGEGGGELVKQLLGKPYEIPMPEVVGVCLSGKPKNGVGPHDAALALIGAVFESGFVKNRILEFFGNGINNLSMDFRNAVDVMTTETTCLSSVWETDEGTREFLAAHGREGDYKELRARDTAYYDRLITIDLSLIEPMIALPYHPSNVYTIREFNADAEGILKSCGLDYTDKIHNGRLYADQGSIVGCAGGSFENIMAASDILGGAPSSRNDFSLSVYPGSQPINAALTANGAMLKLMDNGVVVRTAFCGPCFGAGDVPKNGGLSVRHATRNFQNREGSKPGEGQSASVALMDARSIAATALNGGRITGADEIDVDYTKAAYSFNGAAYKKRVYNGWDAGAKPDEDLKFGPNIADWPAMDGLAENVLLYVAAYIEDPVTTTDELIPSGETSSYRSNPTRLAEFTLSRKAPDYAGIAKNVQKWEETRKNGVCVAEVSKAVMELDVDIANTAIGSAVCAHKPGDGSAREQAASCQRVLGGLANICAEYATKRYMSNLINWGILPFTSSGKPIFGKGDFIYVPNIRKAVENGERTVRAQVLGKGGITLNLPEMTDDQRKVLIAGSIINSMREKI